MVWFVDYNYSAGINSDSDSSLIYGLYVKEFNNVDQEAILFTSNYFKKINPFEYIENYKIISKEYLEKVLKEAFKEENSVKSSINPQKNNQ